MHPYNGIFIQRHPSFGTLCFRWIYALIKHDELELRIISKDVLGICSMASPLLEFVIPPSPLKKTEFGLEL
jgi:hypothetical protein